MAHYDSKHGVVSRSPFELYMTFTDMRNFVQMLPEDKKSMVQADFDSLTGTVQGMTIGIRVTDRRPYSRIMIEDNGSPIHFAASIHFDALPSGDPNKTDFHIEAEVELNMMMKMMLGSKLQDALDKMVDGLVAVSEGRMPEGVDPSIFKDGNIKFN